MSYNRFSSKSRRFEYHGGIDLVDCGDIHLFMMMRDNLYNICVPPDRKGRAPADFYRNVQQNGYTKPPIDRAGIKTDRRARFALYKVVDHMVRHCSGFTFFDVGAFVGDVSLRFANYCRSEEAYCSFKCFDPTLAGDLVPFNIELNGLEKYITHHSLAVSHIDGPISFEQRLGHSDSGSSALSGGTKNTLVRSIRLSSILQDIAPPAAFIKIDTENLEDVIIADCKKFILDVPNALCVEVNASSGRLFDTLAELTQTHALWDIGYVPRPFRARTVRDMPSLLQNVQALPYGYTDVLAISRKMPNFEEIEAELNLIEEEPVGYSLVY